ncbi:hypothetical protein [Bacillus sp. NEB1478]|uniref:hypothetical protein n=1 Tax=Bacillus sp. NEB1478 TaxID=3073816 RepID=UPI002872F1A4|nr:hypothetical protein [Bacillus sp. NEB1478]WNB91275.1 hypothetical protein RGB74_15410 [Bacillus sp. NEB1478]
MSTVSNEYNMGDFRIVVRETKEGTKTARLSSGFHGGILEVEKEKEGIRIKEMEVGSAHITPEHLAMLLYLSGVSTEVVDEIKKIEENFRTKA